VKRLKIVFISASLLASALFMRGQDVSDKPNSALPSELPSGVLGPQLIIWSQQQKPEPVQKTPWDPAKRRKADEGGERIMPRQQPQPNSQMLANKILANNAMKDGAK